MKIVVSILFLFFCTLSIAQSSDGSGAVKLPQKTTTPKKIIKITKPLIIDSANIFKDSTQSNIDSAKIDSTTNGKLTNHNKDSIALHQKDSLSYNILTQYPLLNDSKPFFMLTNYKTRPSTDILFYVLITLVLYFAIIRSVFPRYVKNIFSIVFQTKFRQVQTREQLVQDNVAATLLNILFIISISIFIALLIYKQQIGSIHFWQMAGSTSICLVIIYVGKLLFTQFMGWIFNANAAAKSYSFVVFIINKIAGIIIIPFLFLIAFSNKMLSQQFIIIGFFTLLALLLLRLFLTYKNVSNILKINAIHFFLYFCSLEILPLALVYKVLSNYIGFGI